MVLSGLGGLVSASGRRRASTAASSNHSSADEARSPSENDADTQVMEPDQGNVLSHIISQLRPGADLSRVVLPTFILEPRSMLERITNFMCHPEMLLHIPDIEDPTERFVSVVKFYLSGWHIRPPGVKKPLNPILGEIFSCYWDLDANKRAYYISEQTSHHPPKSSYFYMAPDYHIRIDGTLKPRSRFLGNSAASLMEGVAYLSLLNRGKNRDVGEQYILTQPNMYARGILFGKMKYELGDHSFVRCPELDLIADLDFKTKGWVSGTYNAIGGFIKRESTGEVLYELSGLWSEEMYIKDIKTGHKDAFFNAVKSKPSAPQVRPLDEQEERESQKLWLATVKAVKERNHELATDEKTKIEDRQREEAAKRAQDGVEWHPRLFREVKSSDAVGEDLEWIIHTRVDPHASPEEQTKQFLSIYPVVSGQKLDGDLVIPSRKESSLTEAEGRLIDSGSNDAPGPVSAAAPVEAKEQPNNEIAHLLQSTGKPAEGGRLLDFTEEMKKDLPNAEQK
ncbi:hypothetical protein E4U55_007422 [Claviceps digitariae]|nr:hypothetical protein E4U55_007422 [Claviceps digitariae]